MREPGIAWWPGKIPAGKVCHEIATTMDLLPTIAHFAGTEAPKDRVIDGVDIMPLLFGTGTYFISRPTDAYITGAGESLRLPGQSEFPPGAQVRNVFCYYRGTQLFAARLGKWKAHYFTQTGYGQPKPDPHDPPLLFDLDADPGESFNVADAHPDVIAEINAAVEKHRATVKPVKNQLVETVAK
ncbi:MAG: hypothetical protein ABI318_18400, partial [Chthoniobacteraceae bacterium]